jgi:protein-tyrosine phosphatase
VIKESTQQPQTGGMMNTYNFAPASQEETLVFGAGRPGHPLDANIPDVVVETWLDFMEAHEIKAVCCLLDKRQLDFYHSNLLEAYKKRFGAENVCFAPIPDFALADEKLLLGTILPFLAAVSGRGDRVVVHCSAGMGRTGHVLCAWLVYGRGMSNQAALDAVCASGVRAPFEARGRQPLEELLEKVKNKKGKG